MTPHLLAERYRLSDSIGRGGMGTVWRAEDELLHRPVAVKEVRVDPGLDPDKRDELVARTLREARICAGLSGHPSIVTVHDVVLDRGRPWIVMELLEGRALDRVVQEDGPLDPRRAAEVGQGLLSALRAAHEAGVRHRDVKPGNVLLLPDGRALLSDFGIAVSDDETDLTLTGQVPGSPGYIAPERLRGDADTEASDVWSLGATLYFAVEGRPAYEGATAERLTAALERDPAAPLRAGPMRPALDGMLRRAPERRLTGKALAEALERAAAGTAADDDGGGVPTHLDVSEEIPAGGTTGSADPPKGEDDGGHDGTSDGDRNDRNDPNGGYARGSGNAQNGGNAGGHGSGTLWWPPGRHNWKRLLASGVAGLFTLFLVPLLVELIADRITGPQPEPSPTPSPSPSPTAFGERAETPPGYAEHTVDGFSIMTPEEWKVEEGDQYTVSSPSGSTVVTMDTTPIGGSTPLEHFQGAEDDLLENVDVSHTVAIEEIPHPDGEAALWTFSGGNDTAPMTGTMVLLKTGDRAMTVGFATTSERWKETEAQRRYAFESFRLAE